MPRHNRPSRARRAAGGAAEQPLRMPAGERREQWRGEEYAVRSVAGAAAEKTYRCPGCDQEVRPGLPHVVVWRADEIGAEGRRHWHSGCWSARDRRTPTRRWS